MDILPPSDPRNPASRAKAARVRAKIEADTATPEEIAWMSQYDDSRKSSSKGASAHRRVSYTEEESAAVGEGAASVAQVAAHAAMVREEGRREDNLADRGMMALERAFARQEKMLEFYMGRMQMLEDSHLEMWAKHRESRMREVDAEIALTQAEAAAEGKDDQMTTLANELLPHLLKQLKTGSR